MKALNVPMEDQYHEALEVIQKHYSEVSGIKLTKSQALKRLLWECGNVVKNTGKLWEWEGKSSEWEA